jgi:hypothetical protein
MSMTTYDVECDFCERGFAIDDVYNVENVDGTLNVLCEKCLDENPENVIYSWRSVDAN